MEALDGTIVVTALPAMAQSLGETTLTLTASITVYLVAMTALVPAAGWASSRFGARTLFATAIATFTVASLLCGISPNFWTLIFARALQGAAAAFMSPVGRLIVLRETPKARIIDAIGLIVWPALIAPVIGPPLGGLITMYASWHWIFLINVPLGVIGVWLVLRFIPRHAPRPDARFDAVSAGDEGADAVQPFFVGDGVERHRGLDVPDDDRHAGQRCAGAVCDETGNRAVAALRVERGKWKQKNDGG